LKKIGITTTVPIEILISKGYAPVDLNNLFINDENYFKYIDLAEKDGFPKNTCAFIKGIYGVCIEKGIREVVGVFEGDCSNTKALLEVLKLKGIDVYPFSYPVSHCLEDVRLEIKKFMDLFEVSLEEVQATRLRLGEIRNMAKKIDSLTWVDGKATGFENHLYQVSMSDFGGDWILFRNDIESAITEIEKREARKFPIRLGFIGVPPMTGDLFNFVEKFGAEFVYNEVQREFAFPRWDKSKDIFEQYFDYTYPYDIGFRLSEIESQIELRKIDAVVHYTQAFCYRAIEDIIIRKKLSVPVLTLEGDKLNILDARSKLRIEAFLDMLLDTKEA
jgi:benzoyl-CoA reductase/2-hydroxyglutaryl-CoA dehydratase subunit BcrC/BadD/HgdB